MASRKNVPAATVRAWGRANPDLVPEGARAGLGENARGLVHSGLSAAFAKANKGKQYQPKVAEGALSRTVTVPVQRVDSKGRKSIRKVTVTTAEARKALGHAPGTRGRIPVDALSKALASI